MANQATTTNLPTLTEIFQDTITKLTTTTQTLLDKLIPPRQRATIKSKLNTFTTNHPLLATFILTQIALSGLPLALFLITTVTVTVSALLTGILVGLIGALVFVALTLGFALLVLLPTLFVTTFSAVAVWVWAVGVYYVVKWFNEKKVPGIHRPFGEGLGGLSIRGGSGKGEVNGHSNDDVKARGQQNGGHSQKNGVHAGTVDDKAAATAKVEQLGDGNESQTHAQTKSPHNSMKVNGSEKLSREAPVKGVVDGSEGVVDIGNGVTGTST